MKSRWFACLVCLLVLSGVLALLGALPAPAAALEQKLIASDGAAGDLLGQSVAIDGDTAVVGAPDANGERGAVYVYQRAGNGWAQTAKLSASDAGFDFLGDSVAIEGDTIVAGAPGGTFANKGSVYTFARAGAAARTETAKLTASDGAAGDVLGGSVAIDGDTIVAGAAGDEVGANATQGSVYTFARAGAAARTETAKLTASDGAAGDALGGSVAIDGDTIVASAPGDDVGANTNQGSASIFGDGGPAPTAARVRPNLFRPRGSARQSGRKIVVRVRGRMGGNQGRSCAGRLKMGIRFGKSRRVTRVARMGTNCRYAKWVAFPVRRLPRASRARSNQVTLRVAVRFQGNARLLSDVSATRRIKVRR